MPSPFARLKPWLKPGFDEAIALRQIAHEPNYSSTTNCIEVTACTGRSEHLKGSGSVPETDYHVGQDYRPGMQVSAALKAQSADLPERPPNISEALLHGRIDVMENANSILVLARTDDPQLAMLNGVPHTICCDVSSCGSAAKSAAVVLQWTGNRDMLRAVLSAAPKLRWIHSRSAGLDNIWFPELIESDVVLTNGRGVFSASLGEFVLAAILYFAKDFRRMIRNQMAGRWEPFDVEEIARQTVGIVGYGDIGRAVATRVRALGMRVLATRRHVPADPNGNDPLIEQYFRPEDRRDMIGRCDYVVAAAPLTAETRHMIGEPEFAAMKPTAVIINVGRGPVIDENALVKALTAQRIRGAALDVFGHEPLLEGHPIYRLENVLLSPHCADHTATWQDDAMRFFLEQYARFARGEGLANVVNKRLGY
jgi:phosphoglycerate dehydrogenase-like enzyme